jgi:hypothetical protein
MADFPITEAPEFSGTMAQITNQDRGAPDTFNPRYQKLLDNDNYLKKRTERAGIIIPVSILASDWSAEAPYTQTVPVEGLTTKDNPILVKVIADGATPEQVKAYNKAFGMIDDGDTADGQAT